MNAVDNELHALRLTFYEEADERLAELEESLHLLSRQSDDRDVLNSIFRAVHSIKGGSAACDHAELTHFAHAFENLLSSLRKGTLAVDARMLAILLQGKDVLDALVCAARDQRAGTEGERVERSLAAISAALALLPDNHDEVHPGAEQVDLSAGFAIWGSDTEPSPAMPLAPSLSPPASLRADVPFPHASAPVLETISPERLLSSLGPAARRNSSVPHHPRSLSPSKQPQAPRTLPPRSEPRPPPLPKQTVVPRTSIAPPRPALSDTAMDGVVVRVGQQFYVLPTSSVERFAQLEVGALRAVPKTGELLLTEFGPLPLWSLEALLGRAPRRSVPSNRVAVLLRNRGRHVAVLVDEVLTQGSVTVKSLAQNVGQVRGVCGAVVLEKDLALVLECEALFAPANVALLNPNTI